MKREILFRGKRIDNGKWVYGYYFADTADCSLKENGKCVCSHDGSDAEIIAWVDDLHEYDGFPVDPATVGQYTGLTDKNGVKIFEGDIIKTKKYGKLIGHSNVNDFDVFKVIYTLCQFRLVRSSRGFNLVDDRYSGFEVTGNIYDSPELLEVRDEVG